MKKLSEIISYKDSILELLPNRTINDTDSVLANALSFIDSEYATDVSSLEKSYNKVVDSLKEFEESFDIHLKSIEQEITDLEKEYFERSYEIYSSTLNDSDEYVLQRSNPLTIDNTADYEKRIKMYSGWQYPALYIRPKDNKTIDSIVSCEPLYIADHTLGLLDPVKQLWTKEYQARLRYVLIDDNSDQIFKSMPASQIGLIVATDFFNYKPFEIIKKYLVELLEILRPGGVVMFTYNNCDLPGPVQNVEKSFNCYTPGKLIKSLAESIGYEVLYSNATPNGLNWIELKKSGEIVSLRGGQALAQIKDSRLDN
jgi:hypothetical protein